MIAVPRHYSGPSTVCEPTRRESFWEDCTPNTTFSSFQSYTVRRDEMVDFARKWDPLSFHVDDELAKSSVVGRLFASSRYTLAVSCWLLHRVDPMLRITAAMEFTKMRFPRPVYPGDVLSLTSTVLEQMPSKRPDQGVLKTQIIVANQHGKPVLQWVETAMVQRRVPAVSKL